MIDATGQQILDVSADDVGDLVGRCRRHAEEALRKFFRHIRFATNDTESAPRTEKAHDEESVVS